MRVTAEDGAASLPSVPLTELVEPTEPELLDVSSAAGVGSATIDQPDFVWKTAVVPASSASTSTAPPPLPAPGLLADSAATAAAQYRIVLFTNSSALLYANAAWRRNGDNVVRASMSQLSSTQFLSPPLTLQFGDVLTYRLSWWDLASNAEQRSPITFLYRPPTAEAAQLTDVASSGSSTLPGGTNLGDGQSVWMKLKQATQAPLAPLPSVLVLPSGIGASLLGLATPSSASAVGSVASAVSSGLTSLLSSLSALQTGPAQVVSSVEQSPASQPSNETVLPASSSEPVINHTRSVNATVDGSVSIESLTDLITPLALIGSIAGLTSQASSPSSSLSSLSSYAGAAFCVLPCATASASSDVMVSCLGGCAQPFLPAGLSSSEATSVINALHDYVVTNVQNANVTVPSSSDSANSASPAATDQTTTRSNDTATASSGDTGSNAAALASVNSTTTNNSNTTTVSTPALLSSATNSAAGSGANGAGSSSSSGPASPPTRNSASVLPPSAVSNILSWLTATQSAATPSLLSGATALLPAPAAALAGPATALARGLSSGLSYLSTPLFAGLSSLSTGQVSIASNPSATGGITISSLGQSVSLPLSVLSALLTPLLPPGTSTAAVASTASYVAGMTCMLPCIGSSFDAGVTGTSSCLGGCIDAVMPGTGSGGAKLVADIDSIMQLAGSKAPTVQPAALTDATSTASSSPAISSPLSTAPISAVSLSSAPSAAAALPSATDSATVTIAPAESTASLTLSLTGATSGLTAVATTANSHLPAVQGSAG